MENAHSITSSSWEGSKFCAEQRAESLAKSDTHCIHCRFSTSFFRFLFQRTFVLVIHSTWTHVILRALGPLCCFEEGLRRESIFLMLLNIETVKLSLESLVQEWRPCSLGFSITSQMWLYSVTLGCNKAKTVIIYNHFVSSKDKRPRIPSLGH